jgi:Leucine-rich repeat (LRR) protein
VRPSAHTVQTIAKENFIMVEPVAVSIAGTVVSKLLEQVMEATKIAIRCNESCKVLHALLKGLQPLVDLAVRQISQSNSDNAFESSRSAVHGWLDEVEGTLKRAAGEVNKCIKQQPDFNPVSRYNTGKRILDVTESVNKLLKQASFVVLAVTLSESSRAKNIEKMMEEHHEMLEDLRATTQRIEFANFTQESLQENYRTSSVQQVTSAIKSAFCNLWPLRPSDNMSRVETGASSSSSRPRELIVNEDSHKLTDIQQVQHPVIGLDNFTMRLQQSITSTSSTDAEPRCVGVRGMGGAGKTLLAQIAYNSRQVREHFKGGELIWLTVSQTPNIKGLYDSFCRQLGLKEIRVADLGEYRSRLYNEFLSRRVFLVLDDVWNQTVLEQLDLAKGPGSVTLVTTRNQPVLEKAGVIDEDEMQVGVLSKEHSWELFCVHAFPRGISNIPFELEGVAKLVADECKGLPLALKVIGASMVGKTMPPEWEFQLTCLRESRQLPEKQEEEALFGRLKLSYDNLDNDNPVSKECFLAFAAFPEDHVVTKEELIKLWKPQQLSDDLTQSLYFCVGLLIARSLIELVHTRRNSFACKVHDVMRDLALHIIEGQNPITCLYKPGKNLVEFPGDWIRTCETQPCEVRKLSLMENDLTTLNGVTFSAPKLEVLLLARNEKLETMPEQFLKGIENLKVLDLSKCHKLKSLPREIGNLRQLTYLDLDECNSLKSLPKEIGKLKQLTNLYLDHCWKLKSLPKEIGKLTQLTHLHLLCCEKLKSFPEEVGNLTQLIHIDLSSCNDITKLPKSIGYLQSLQWLSLRTCRHLKYLPSTIGDLKSLQYLSLTMNELWGKQSKKLYGETFRYICQLTTLTDLRIQGEDTHDIVELCDQLSKLVNLKSFHIYEFYNLETLPDAIQSMVCLEEFWVYLCTQIKILPSCIPLFSKLKVLNLEVLSSLESLPALNTLKMLSTLNIIGCGLIKKLPDSFTSSNAFPSLKKLDCLNSGLVEFPKVEDGAMPKLQILNLNRTNIKSLPDTLIYLKNLEVVYICHDNLCKKFKNTWLSGKFISERG